MKILQVNKFLWLSGGVERYMFDLSTLLESKGHEVSFFSMQDEERNRPCPQTPYFVTNIDYQRMGPLGAVRKATRIVSKTVYSLESKSKIRQLVRDLRPDVAHVHSVFHQISPSVLPVLREEGIPIEEKSPGESILELADELCLTNTIMVVMPVGRIDGKELPARRPVTQRLAKTYTARIAL